MTMVGIGASDPPRWAGPWQLQIQSRARGPSRAKSSKVKSISGPGRKAIQLTKPQIAGKDGADADGDARWRSFVGRRINLTDEYFKAKLEQLISLIAFLRHVFVWGPAVSGPRPFCI